MTYQQTYRDQYFMKSAVIEKKHVHTSGSLGLTARRGCRYHQHLNSLAIIPSVTRGRAKMQKTVIPSLTRSVDSETDGDAMVITVALLCRESVDQFHCKVWTRYGDYSGIALQGVSRPVPLQSVDTLW